MFILSNILTRRVATSKDTHTLQQFRQYDPQPRDQFLDNTSIDNTPINPYFLKCTPQKTEH